MADTAKLVTLKCPNCGAALKIAPTVTDFACAYCGAQQTVERDGGIISLQLISESVTHIVANTDKTASELAIQRLNAELMGLQHQYHKIAAERQTLESGVKTKQKMELFGTIFVVGGGWLLVAHLAGWVAEGFCAASVFAFILLGLWLGYVCGEARKALEKIQQDLGPQIEALTRQISATQQSIAYHTNLISSKVPTTSPQKSPTVPASTTKTPAVPHTAPALKATSIKPPNTTPTGELTKAEGRRRDIRAILLVAIPTGLLFSFMRPVIPITLGALLLIIFLMHFVRQVRAVPRFVLRLKPERKARNAVKLVFAMLLGSALLIGGIAVALQNAEEERIAEQNAAEEAHTRQLIADASKEASGLVNQADLARQSGDVTLAVTKLDEASLTATKRGVTLPAATLTDIANVRVDILMNEAISALRAGDVATATRQVDAALANTAASNLSGAKELDAHIKNATDLKFLTATFVNLPDSDFDQIRTDGTLPASLVSGYAVLDNQTAAAVKQHLTEFAVARIQAEQERTRAALALEEAERKKQEEERNRDLKTLVGDKYVFVAVTLNDLDRLNKLCNAKDSEGVVQMATNGQMLPVPSGTKCRIIGYGFATREVRIMEGPYYRRSGFVAAEFVR